MSGGATTHIIDDRGVRVVAQKCPERSRLKPWSVASILKYVVFLFVIGSLGLFVSVEVRPFGLGPVKCAALLLGVCIAIAALLRWKLVPAMADVAGPDPTSAWLLFQGNCAACGYAIRGIEPQADGCTVCPECGGAWRAVRWSSVDSHAKGEGAIVRVTIASVDDRGVPLSAKLAVPPRWLHRHDLAPSLRHEIEHRWRAAFSSWGAFVLVLTTIVSGGFSAILAANYFESAGDRWRMLPVIGTGILLGDVVMLVVFTLLVRSPGEWSLRREWLAQGVCPNCGCPFAKDAKPQFDGWTACSECGRAWKR